MQTPVAANERRFAIYLFLPAFLVLVITTTLPLIYLAWTSVNRVDLTSPWITGFAGADNYSKMLGDPRFWNSLELTVVIIPGPAS